MKPSLRPLALLALPLILTAADARAHPLMAEPVNHPFVFTFDQFFLPEDPDEHVVEGGHLLLAELNCAACHEAPDAWRPWLAPKPGPRLEGIGSRMEPDMLWLFIRSPQHFKKGTQMPGLFSGEEGDEEKVEALVEYLSASKAEIPPLPAGDAARGRALYHQSGCVACHEPAADYRPAGAAPDIEPDRPGNASAPIVLADVWHQHALAAFLHQPLRFRPAGRMPDMLLTTQEAADIAAYLHLGRTQPQSALRAALQIPPQGVERGKEVFREMRCAACHEAPGLPPGTAPPERPMLELRPGQGCLAGKQGSGIPRYDLNDLQKRALRLALTSLQAGTMPEHLSSAAQKTDWQMTRLNCHACHDRAYKGGPEDPRALYFTGPGPAAEVPGGRAHLPPSLDGAGTRLGRGGLEKILLGPRTGPQMHTRMPRFGETQVRPLLDWLMEADKKKPGG